jgi:1-acyl-sn-glycerol-3-phosphate acyltransferase
MKYISKLLLKMFGWRIIGEVPPIRKMVIISAPHTSMWDFIVGRLTYFVLGIKPSVMIKQELFFFPVNLILKNLGGIPVYRDRKTNIIDRMVEEFYVRDEFYLTITPEGTRKKVMEWKNGFYVIALKAGVPIVPTSFDYKRKEIAVYSPFFPTGDMQGDIRTLRKIYVDISPRHPENFDKGQN